MLCPKDQSELKQIVRDDVIIDHCPECHGVWLDRGELDKLIEKSHEHYSGVETVEAEEKKPDYPDFNKGTTGSFKNTSGYKGASSNFLGSLFDLSDPGAAKTRK